MRQLLVLRHAKSDWTRGEPDHARTINARGRRGAALIGSHVAAAGLVPQLVLCSSAVRARTTLELAIEAGAWETSVTVTDGLYDTDVTGALSVITEAPDVERLMVVGHEPTWSSLVTHLTGARVQVKTATLVVLELDRGDWSELDAGSCSIVSVVRARHLEPATGSQHDTG